MSRHPWMPLYVADYLLDTKELSLKEHGIYLLLLMLAWRRPDGRLPADEKWLRANLPPMHGRTFNRFVRDGILKKYFTLKDGHFENKRLLKELEIATKLSRKQSENATKRWAAVRENKDLADATAMPSQSQSHKNKNIYSAAPNGAAPDTNGSGNSAKRGGQESEVGDEHLGHPQDFESFWKAYPRRVGRRAAERAFLSAAKRVEPARLISAVRNFKFNTDTKFVPHPATWLNQDRWADEDQRVTGTQEPTPHGTVIGKYWWDSTAGIRGRWREFDGITAPSSSTEH
jgi:uncharacterized protein YdaU (DUF1376 family)